MGHLINNILKRPGLREGRWDPREKKIETNWERWTMHSDHQLFEPCSTKLISRNESPNSLPSLPFQTYNWELLQICETWYLSSRYYQAYSIKHTTITNREQIINLDIPANDLSISVVEGLWNSTSFQHHPKLCVWKGFGPLFHETHHHQVVTKFSSKPVDSDHIGVVPVLWNMGLFHKSVCYQPEAPFHELYHQQQVN